VPVRFVLPDVDEHLSVIADTGGPIGLALWTLSGAERAPIRMEAEDPLSRFATERGHERTGVALWAVAG
jgi:hypothetical protein